MRESRPRPTGRQMILDLARAVTPPRFLRRYQERSRFRRQVRNAAGWGALLLLGYAFVLADSGLLSIAWRMLRIRQLEHDVRVLETREAWLREELAQRQDGKRTIERLAREKYGMALPGEKIYRIVEVSEAEARRLERERRRLEKDAPPVPDLQASR